ncbi:MAG: hypothetical protein ABW224_00700 [Kibdelosporangium sp.]
MWTVARLIIGRSFVEYQERARTERAYHSSRRDDDGKGGWQISGEDDAPLPHHRDLPDDSGARLLRDLLGSAALRGLSESYVLQPILAEVANDASAQPG